MIKKTKRLIMQLKRVRYHQILLNIKDYHTIKLLKKQFIWTRNPHHFHHAIEFG